VTALIISVAVLAYLAAAGLTARSLFGRWRAHAIDYEGPYGFPHADPVERLRLAKKRYARGDQRGDAAVALFCGLIWPLSLAVWGAVAGYGWLVRTMLDTAPHRSRLEVEVANAAMAKRITDLEKELKIR